MIVPVMLVPKLLPAVLLMLLLAACSAPRNEPADSTPWRQVALAREAARGGNRSEAIRILRDSLARHPRDRAIRRELGFHLAAAGNPDAARVLSSLSVEPGVSLVLARTPIREKDAVTAARHLTHLASTPDRIGPEAYEIQAGIARLRGDPAAAVNALRQALVLDPGRPEAWLGLLEIAEQTGDAALRREARAELARACPDHPALSR